MTNRILIVVVAVVCLGCDGRTGTPGGPTAPSLAADPQTRGADVAVGGPFAMDAPLADGERAVEVTADLDFGDAEAVVEGVEVEADAGASLPAPIFDVPGKPAPGTITAKGLVITMTWGQAPPGKAGLPTNYLVYCSCTGKFEKVPAGVRVKVFTATKPGTYTTFVAAQNSKGSGPTLNFKITVTSINGTYTGSFNKAGAFRRVFSGFSCTWTVTFAGTMSVILKAGAGGQTGTSRITGTFNAPSPGSQCLPAAGSYTGDRPLTFTPAGFTATQPMSVANLTFTGALAAGVIKGTLVISYTYGTGTITIPVTLNKT